MVWIKRNLFLVAGGLVALVLLGLAGFFLYTKFSQDQAMTAQLDQSTQELKTLVTRDPHPGTDKVDNLGAAKNEHKRLQAFLDRTRRRFPPTFTNQPTSREFRAMLDTTVSDLQRRAEWAGGKLPDDYWFGFTAQKASMTFSTNLLGPLTGQLLDVSALCNILFNAKIVSLERVKRASAGQDDGGGGSALTSLLTTPTQDYLEAKGVTNQWAVVTPYEVTFQGFSSELAEVLESLIRSPHCFVVKTLIVERADAASSLDGSMTGTPGDTQSESTPAFNPYARYGGPMMRGFGRGGMSEALARRYGVSSQPPADAPKPASRGNNFLEERVLRVTLSVNSVKLRQTGGR